MKVNTIHTSDIVLDKKATKREMFANLFGEWTENERLSFEERIKDMGN
ncbi:MAG: hypothetical protein Q8O19_03540 [Rectinemataceae bacterium]|nr:hypothetical protein [Rectinemataceae bacterium]